MSIYISGVEIPPAGKCKTITIFDNGTVVKANGSETLGKAISVPEHGRTIDADVLFKEIGMDVRFGILEAMYIQSIIHDAPTIIPADKEGEG